ncbi:hypothetical protein V498_08759 [Pseudogymnoascus sp. VKM F-4517 (FW-2822)]|nr:hypothetical protein V498_08759 [Pseudogymnoascus sp. VKM F-4517 (FW-2822)]
MGQRAEPYSNGSDMIRDSSDRALPTCSRCVRIDQLCIYPSSAEKPGPKAGTSRTAKRLRTVDWNNHAENGAPYGFQEGGYNESESTTASGSNRPNVANEGQRWSSLPPPVPSNDSHVIQAPNIGASIRDPNRNRDQITIPTPPSIILPSEGSIIEARTLTQAIHPSHEPITRSNSRNRDRDPPGYLANPGSRNRMIFKACELFEISIETYQYLLSSYFENMTAFSLFNWPHFDSKLQSIRSENERHALLAAMFSLAARFPLIEKENPHVQIPSSRRFYDLASGLIESCLDECADRPPPLCLLQALLLTTFQQLIKGVRGRSWRVLGTCIRIAYELQLHCIDAKELGRGEDWQEKEEKRRAWWTIWEFDVFASTIRRLPTAIDWSQNLTWLPVEDDLWYNNMFQASCFLAKEPMERIKLLQQCGNEGGKSWFIVINSLTRIAQSLPYHHSNNAPASHSHQGVEAQPSAPKDFYAENAILLANTLHDFSLALPSALHYKGEYIGFECSNNPRLIPSPRLKDHGKYSIHMMKQLAKFVLHHQVFLAALAQPDVSASGQTFFDYIENYDPGSWNRYIEGIENVVSLIRHSAPNYVYYVNPFLANTIWFAAAAQITARLYRPSSATSCEAADSNFELLRSSVILHIRTWEISSILVEKLDTLESRLRRLAISPGDTSGRDLPQESTATALEMDSMSREIGFNALNTLNGIGEPFPFEWEIFDFLGLDQLLNYETVS